MKTTFYSLVLLLLVSCSKTKQSYDEARVPGDAELLQQYRLTLATDADFIRNCYIDKELSSFQCDSLRQTSDHALNKMAAEILLVNTDSGLVKFYKKYQFANPGKIVALFREKVDALLKIKVKFPLLASCTEAERRALFIHCYQKVGARRLALQREAGCVSDYVDAISDCDTDFAIATAFSVIAAAGATIVATPLAGAGTLSASIGAAYLSHMRCSSSAARTYRQCQGYE